MGTGELIIFMLVIAGAASSSYYLGYRKGHTLGYLKGMQQILLACNEAFKEMQKDGTIKVNAAAIDSDGKVIKFPTSDDKVH